MLKASPAGCRCMDSRTEAGDIILLKLAKDFQNSSPYLDYYWEGGLFAAADLYLDEDMNAGFCSLLSAFDNNPYYEIDYTHGGRLRQEPLLEDLISPDSRRELVSLLVPVKKRLPDPKLFKAPEEIPPDSITHYRVTEQGEAEYISWISTRVLSTNVEVRLPFRVDIDFRIGEESGGWGHGKKEESIRFHHGDDLNFLFGINMYNHTDERLSRKAICFHQPVFGDYYSFPGRGAILPEVYNHLTWIVGQNHFAVIINEEIRYCGRNFPYMSVNMYQEQRLFLAPTAPLKNITAPYAFRSWHSFQKSGYRKGH